MLPTTIESGFEDPVWVPIPALNDGQEPVAELLLKPYSHGDLAEVQETFNICRRCDGIGQVSEIAAAGESPTKITCPLCSGRSTGKSGLDLDVRLAIGTRIIKGGRSLLGVDPQTGVTRPITWSDKVRDGICHTLPTFYLVIGEALRLGAQQDAVKKDSPIQPPADSPMASEAAGAMG